MSAIGRINMNMYVDWQTEDDYDPDGAEWIDTTTIESAYQIQVDAVQVDHFRHRHINRYGAWTKGKPPVKNAEDLQQEQ